MRTNTKYCLYIMLIFACFTACKNDQQARIEDAVKAHIEAKKEDEAKNAGKYTLLQKTSWILGSWKGVLGEGVSVERWYKQDDSTYAGAGLFIKGKVTLSQETLQLAQKGKDLYYLATVKDQNDNKPVSFKMTKFTANELVFENPGHDFPQKITYKRYSADSLVAEISGEVNGQRRSEQFPMKRGS